MLFRSKKSRLRELTTTFICCLLGVTFLYFTIILNDINDDYKYYYEAFFSLLAIHFFLTFSGRLILLNIAKRHLLSGKISFNTLLIGDDESVYRIFRETEKKLHNTGYRYIGYVNINLNSKNGINKQLPLLGSLDRLEKIIDEDRKSTRLNSSHIQKSRMPSSA